jgi:hypothetical protein
MTLQPVRQPLGPSPTAVQAGEREVSADPVIDVDSVAEMIKSPAPAVAEPVRKKQKTDQVDAGGHATGGSSYTKFAVTALAGAAAGAIGTILGLAALPQDFFV